MANAWMQPIWLNPEWDQPQATTALAMNASARKVAGHFQTQSANAITHIGFPHVSTTGTSPTYRVSVQGINASGQPDGTIKGGGSPASATFNPTSLGYAANSYQWVALTNSYTPTRGEDIAIVIDYSSGTINASNTSSIGNFSTNPLCGKPFASDFQAVWTLRQNRPLLAYRTTAETVGYPVASWGNQTFTSTAEYGFKFTLPTWFSTCTIAGFKIMASLPAASTFGAKLYSGGNASDTTVLQSVSGLDGDNSPSTQRLHEILFTDSSLATLTGGSTYRISIVPGGAVNFTLFYIDVTSAANDFAGYPFGNNVCWTTRSGGNWTDTTTRRPYVALLMADMTAGSGSGGGSLINSQQLVRQGWIG